MMNTGSMKRLCALVAALALIVCAAMASAACERHYYRDGKCIDCGHKNACSHSGAVFEEDGRQKNMVVVDNHDDTHTRTFDVYHFYTCRACSESFALYKGRGSETEEHVTHNGETCDICDAKLCEMHYLRNGVCIDCGVKPACKHTGATFNEDGRQRNVVIADQGNGKHKRTFDVYHFYTCPTCKKVFAKYMEQGTEIEAHEYHDGKKCRCGIYKDSTCAHRNRSEKYSQYIGNVTDNGDGTHSGNCSERYGFWCDDCERFIVEYINEEKKPHTDVHDFDPFGFCTAPGCEATKPCGHENRTENYTQHIGDSFTDNGLGSHVGMVYDRYGFWCDDCETFIVLSEDTTLYEYSAEHDYDSYGFCTAPGCSSRQTCQRHVYQGERCAACGWSCVYGIKAVFRLPSDIKRIEKEAFVNADAQAVVIPDGCTQIGSLAFSGCTKLKKVLIPSSVTSIASDAFKGCSGLTIYAPQMSPAHKFAQENGYGYEPN